MICPVYTVQYSTARVCHLNASLTKAPRFSQKALSPRIADSKCSQTPLPPLRLPRSGVAFCCWRLGDSEAVQPTPGSHLPISKVARYCARPESCYRRMATNNFFLLERIRGLRCSVAEPPKLIDSLNPGQRRRRARGGGGQDAIKDAGTEDNFAIGVGTFNDN
jgi:hypothetical protein